MENIGETGSPRIWWIAGLLSFLVPGLGQFYNGETTKGFFFNFLISTWGGLMFSLVYYILQHPMTKPGLAVIFLLFFISIAAELLVILEAIRSAGRIGPDRRTRRYHRWYIYLIVILVVSGINQSVSTAFRENILKAYKIPSRSMQPTIEAGDYLFCNQLYYRDHNPAREDLVIFKYPKNEKVEYIKRIVGIPGDMVELKQNTLYVNGKKVSEPYALYNHAENSEAADYGPYFVSDDEYFVMGDNRNNSSDSRDFGTIRRQSIRGKAVFVYFSWNKDTPGWNIFKKLASIRFSRIGKIL